MVRSGELARDRARSRSEGPPSHDGPPALADHPGPFGVPVMATRFASARHQAALSTPTGYRRWSRITFSRGGVSRVLEPISGSFTQDHRRNGFWDGRLTFAGDDVMPRRPGDLLTPFGTTVTVELGLTLLDGSLSTVPYGTYMVASSKAHTIAGARAPAVGLVDASDQAERYRSDSPPPVASGTDLPRVVN